MKIWHIPPRYLDDATLLSEQRTLIYLSDNLVNPFISLDGLYQRYKQHHQYIVLRLILVSQELETRNLGESINVNELLESITTDDEYKFSLQDVNRDIDILLLIWEEFQDFDSQLYNFLELLNLTDSEQIYQELQWIIQLLIEEYDL